MAKKVYELAKEIGVQSKELVEKAEKLGLNVKSHMSVLSEKDIELLTGKSEKKDEAGKKAFPFGKPIVDEEMLAKRNKPPVGKPIVNEELLANREQEKHQESEDVKEVKKEAQTEKPENKPEIKAEPKAEAKAEPKADTKKEAKADSKKDGKPSKEAGKSQGSKGERPANDKHVSKDKKHGEGHGKKDGDSRHDRGDRNNKGDRRSDKKDRSDRRNGQKRDSGRPQDGRRDSAKDGSRDGSRDGRRFDGKNSRGDGKSGDRKQDRFGKDNRSQNGQNRRGGQGSSLERMETKSSSSYGKREDNKKHGSKDKDRNKYDKFEKRSLEKQIKKKHVKNKPQVEEPDILETLPEGTILLNVPITVAGFCELTEVSTSKVIMTLMKMGVMANINQNLDEDTVMLLADDFGLSVAIGNVEKEDEEVGIETFEDEEKDLKARPPIITVMGHVDHGKTSLLDAIRKTNVTASESGGITQHIGASEVKVNGQKIVFLDTPGHEAFTAMRARGAHVTDIAVLVVAADDSVKPQTVESISHAKAAGVPIIVAINKMDKPGANPDRVKQDLTEHGILVEDWGGDVISVPVSAKTGDGIMQLLEMILLQAEMMELKANPSRLAMGSVIEARLDKSRGPVATLLVTNGTLESGQSVVAGTCAGRIRLMTDFKGKTIKKASPATAVEILGLTEVPQAGDEFNAVKEDKVARDIAEKRKEKLREEVLAKTSATTLDKLFSQIQEGEVKELNLIIKGDVQGSVGALVSSLEKLNNENVKVNVVHTGVGTVTESDVMLAGTSNAVIIGFNVRPTTAVQTMADRENIEIRTYRVIYDVIDDVENAMKGMLDPEYREEILGKAEIRTTFKVPGVGIIGGSYVTEGKVARNAQVRLVRDGIVIHEGTISSLKRFKDDAKEVNQGYECGIGIEHYNDIKEGDVIECFHMVEIKVQ